MKLFKSVFKSSLELQSEIPRNILYVLVSRLSLMLLDSVYVLKIIRKS